MSGVSGADAPGVADAHPGWKVRTVQRIGHLLPSRGNSRCGRCHAPWWATEWHTTDYSESGGCFPLCEPCWSGLTVEQRVPFYMDLIEEWGPRHCDNEKAKQILDAVLEGK